MRLSEKCARMRGLTSDHQRITGLYVCILDILFLAQVYTKSPASESRGRGKEGQILCRGRLRENTPVLEGSEHRLGLRFAVEALGRGHSSQGCIRHVRVRRELELGFEDDRIRFHIPQGIADIPQRTRPDL